jgi:hypothetical protein
LGVGFVAEAAAHDPVVALISFGPWGALNLALLYLLFRKGKNSLAFALGLGAAPVFIGLFAVVFFALSRLLTLSGLRHGLFILSFSGIVPPFFTMMSQDNPHATLGALLLLLFSISLAMYGISSIVAFLKMGARYKGDGKVAIGLWRRNMLPACRLADISDPVCRFRWAPPDVNNPCPAARRSGC